MQRMSRLSNVLRPCMAPGKRQIAPIIKTHSPAYILPKLLKMCIGFSKYTIEQKSAWQRWRPPSSFTMPPCEMIQCVLLYPVYSGTSIFLWPHATTYWMGFDPRTLYARISAYGHIFCVYYAKHDSLEIYTAKYWRYSHLRTFEEGIRINSL